MDGTAIKLPLIRLSGNEPQPRARARARIRQRMLVYICLLVPAVENSSTGRLSAVPRREVTLGVHLIVAEIYKAARLAFN